MNFLLSISSRISNAAVKQKVYILHLTFFCFGDFGGTCLTCMCGKNG